MASGTVSPCEVEPVSGLKAMKPPSSAGIKTAVSVMQLICPNMIWSQAVGQNTVNVAEK
jgi:hypothetical protein